MDYARFVKFVLDKDGMSEGDFVDFSRSSSPSVSSDIFRKAILRGCVRVVDLMLSNSIGVGRVDRPLLNAAARSNAEMLGVLLARGVLAENDLPSILSLSCSSGKVDVVDVCLAHGTYPSGDDFANAYAGGYVKVVSSLEMVLGNDVPQEWIADAVRRVVERGNASSLEMLLSKYGFGMVDMESEFVAALSVGNVSMAKLLHESFDLSGVVSDIDKVSDLLLTSSPKPDVFDWLLSLGRMFEGDEKYESCLMERMADLSRTGSSGIFGEKGDEVHEMLYASLLRSQSLRLMKGKSGGRRGSGGL